VRRLPSSVPEAQREQRGAASRHRRLGAVLALGLGAVLSVLAPAAGAQDDDSPTAADAGTVEVIEVSGLLDPILVDFVQRSIADAEATDAVALVLQLNSPGAVVSDDRLNELAQVIADAEVPVAVWIGPSGARARGGAAEIALVADDLGMAPGTDIGKFGPVRVDPALVPDDRVRPAGSDDVARNDEEALEAGIADRLAPTVGDFNVDIDGFVTDLVEPEGGGAARREPVTATRFAQLSLPSQLLHTAASPAVAYLFLVVGMFLVLFEFFTAGVGVAAVVALLCLLPAGYGLGVLPIRGWALALIILSLLAFAVDIQTGVPRFWTGIGFVMFVIGSFRLFDGVGLSWITLLVVMIGVPITVLAGMPAMVRTRFSTPTIGREWMVGEEGRAVGAVDPEGTVLIREALWRARVNRATPIAAGEPVVVVALDGPVLEVEPEEGAARDYRER
jgi:membrane-bound serine protease (ClpP class)